MAVSLDGFIAGPGGDLSWLNEPRYEVAGEDFGYGKFFSSVDALVMGRNTFNITSGFDEWPYKGKPVIVLSSGSASIPPELADEVSVLGGDIPQLVQDLSERGYERIYVDGGITIQRFLEADCLDEIVLTRIPVLLGAGIPLFSQGAATKPLEHMETKTYDNGFVQSRYRTRM